MPQLHEGRRGTQGCVAPWRGGVRCCPPTVGGSQETKEPVLLTAGLEGCSGETSASLRALDWLLERAEHPSPGAGPLSAGGLQKGSCRVWGSVGGGCRVSESPPTARGKSEPGESPLAPVC